MPRHRRERELELFGEIFGYSGAFFIQGGKSAYRAAELQDKTSRPCLAQSFAMTIDGIKPSRDLGTKRRRQRLLHPGTADHHRRAMCCCELSEVSRNDIEIV